MVKKVLLGALSLSVLLAYGSQAANGKTPGTRRWVAVWSSSPAGATRSLRIAGEELSAPYVTGGTARYRIRLALRGQELRFRLSNEYSDRSMAVSSATVGLAGKHLDATPGSIIALKFGGQAAVVIPAGSPVVSDPVQLGTSGPLDLIVNIHVANGLEVLDCTEQWAPRDQIVIVGIDATLHDQAGAVPCRHTSRPIVSRVTGLVPDRAKVVVTLGDSITDGDLDDDSGERGWPGALSSRLGRADVAVVNAGIAGNRLLASEPMFGESALARLDRDVLSMPGVRYLFVLEGINDIGMSGAGGALGDTPLVEPGALIAAYSQIINRAHEQGIKVIGATLLPFEGAFYYSADKDRVRQEVNHWIRESGAFDAIVDFEAVMRDPRQPTRLNPAYDGGDHLHPNANGYRQMARGVELGLFR